MNNEIIVSVILEKCKTQIEFKSISGIYRKSKNLLCMVGKYEKNNTLEFEIVSEGNYKGNTAQFKAHGLLEYCSVSLPKKSRQGDSLTSIYLYNLTKNLTVQSAHLNYAVLPIHNFTSKEESLWMKTTAMNQTPMS